MVYSELANEASLPYVFTHIRDLEQDSRRTLGREIQQPRDEHLRRIHADLLLRGGGLIVVYSYDEGNLVRDRLVAAATYRAHKSEQPAVDTAMIESYIVGEPLMTDDPDVDHAFEDILITAEGLTRERALSQLVLQETLDSTDSHRDVLRRLSYSEQGPAMTSEGLEVPIWIKELV